MIRGPEAGFQKKEGNESRAEFAGKIMSEEGGMIGGVLSKIEKAPESVKRGIMVLMAAGVLFSATEAGAQETWKKHFGYEGWEKHYGYGERVKEGGTLEEMIRAANMREERQLRAIDAMYQKRLMEIRLSIIDITAQQNEIRKLDQWRLNEYRRAWFNREVEVHAAKVKSGQYRK